MTSQNSRSILGNVPFDILVHLLGFLCPLDILAARQTCKLLQEATSQRSLWIGVLRSVCAENHIFWPTYPIKDMSTSDLVKAALTPTRFLSFIFKERDPALEGIEPRTVIHFTPGNLNRLRNPCPIDLLPGGRFLVCAEYKILSIWDLGCPSEGCSLSELILVACVATEECHRFMLKPTNDALGIQVVVLSAPANNVTVFEIRPTFSNPSFRQITSLDVVLHEGWDIYCLCGDRLFIVWQDIVTVWDFSRNLWASWEVERSPMSISAIDNHVILVEDSDDHEARVGIWKIPPLHPIGHTSASLGVLPADTWFAPLQVEDLISVEYYGGLDDWYRIGGVGRTQCIIDGYGCRIESFSKTAFLRVELPLKLEDNQSTHNVDLDFHIFDFLSKESIFGSLGVCNENAISVWTSPFGIQFHATRRTNIVNRPHTPVDLTPSPRSASVHIRMPLVPEVAAFCPVSGRLCYLLGDDSSTIFITDCLSRNITSESGHAPSSVALISGSAASTETYKYMRLWGRLGLLLQVGFGAGRYPRGSTDIKPNLLLSELHSPGVIRANNVTAFEIYPTSSNPSFRKITSLDVVLHEAWEIYCLCGDRLSINYQNIVTVWDFSRNLWASWEVERTPASISATENHVILVEGDHETRVGVWKIPPLHPIGHTSAFHGVLPPDICFTLPQVEDLLSVEYYGGLDDWYLTGAVGWTRCIIDVYVTHLGFRRRSALLRVELPLKLEDAQFTHKDDLDLHTFDFATRENIFGSLGVCNENAVSVWTSPFGIQFHAARRSNVVNRPCTPVDLTPSPRSASVHIRMPLVPEVAAFCAVSGRLCYLLHGDSSNTVYITDCLFRNTSED
ncbi:uncharacterized protein LACBIDRAFT_294302 [Laccaria bicolor S238N-H82]|uniref:Predicted protein n=1 Tax=Laccaria bicolor (strain S238N-H82 / ATCC MYA-4686) TaxID=486041 RepID=B0DBA2_LACBS|nr:uncharacterized protein LACBIDRAFT_294302 [Laccaria bicolor S238N-H82]EDR07955.1 predicted protein [Laccaria bicolor S238N-H82]|eukprot:XP_001881025.1 predicted protein [Laccaria bicolor S238N-H82]